MIWRVLGIAIFALVLTNVPLERANAAEDELSKPIRATRNIVFREVAGEKVKADVFRPDSDAVCPSVVLIHGGGWSAGDKWNMHDHARQLAQAGYVAVTINYRLAPRYLINEQIEDCRVALRWWSDEAEKYSADPKRLAVWGYSAGAHLSCLIAAKPEPGSPPIAAVIAGGAPCEFSAYPEDNKFLSLVMGGTRRQVPEIYKSVSPVNFANAKCPPTLFYHGTQDIIVPPKSSRMMFEELKKCGVVAEYHQVEGQGHLTTFIDAPAREKAIEFLNQHLQSEH